MFIVFVYFFFLFIAPQLWLQPFVGIRTDLIVLPLWFVVIALQGRALDLVRFRTQDWFFAAMLAWIVINPLFNPTHALTSQIIFEYAKWFVVYRFLVVTLNTPQRVRSAMLMILFFGLVLTVEGIQHFHSADGLGWANQKLGWVTVEAQEAGIGGRTRWVSMFDGPGTFCVFYTVCLPIAMQFMGKAYGGFARLTGLAMTAALLVATYYTGARGGFYATLGTLGLYGAVKVGITPARAMLMGLALVAAVALAPGYLTSTKDSHNSAQNRIDVWAVGIKLVSENPLFGVGKGNYARHTGRLIAHNSMIEIASETGIPAVFCWFGMIYMAFKTLILAYRETQDQRLRELFLAISLSLAGYLLSSLFITLEYELLYVVLAMAGAVGVSRASPVPFRGKDLMRLLGLMIGLAIFIKIAVATYY